MTFPNDVWEAGATWTDYRAGVTQNEAAFDADYANPAFGPGDLGFLTSLPPLKVAAVAADWCPDVYHTVGTWARAVERLDGWELRIFVKERFPELMKRYLWLRDKERVPVYAFHDLDGRALAWWSGRSATAEAALDETLGGVPYGEADDGAKARAGEMFATRYPSEFRAANFREICDLLAAVFHRTRAG